MRKTCDSAVTAPAPAKKARRLDFFGKLRARVETTGSLLCVGLDPHAADLSEQTGRAALEFCKRIIDATKHVAVAYKPNSAFFEALGGDGVAALKETVEYIPCDIPVLLDVKRGDISSTAKAYASAAFDSICADAVTVSPYMGSDSIEPFVASGGTGRAVFVLCKTSNKSAGELQTLKLQSHGGVCLYEHVAHLSAGAWGRFGGGEAEGSIGLVVGATDVEALRRTRAAAPRLWILAPGVGAQGGDLEGVLEAGLRADGSGVLVTVSRGISRAASPRAAAEALSQQISELRSKKKKATAAAVTTDNKEPSQLMAYQRRFIDTALKLQVLRFGSFKLKSGRLSPYFFNAGLFRTGTAMTTLSRCYATAIKKSGIQFDVIFGPAYKGIPLVTAVAMALSESSPDKPMPFAYNRKERKDHGEGGILVGAELKGKRVLIVDDVITAGTAVREAIGMLTKAGATAVGVALALDRQEVATGSTKSAVEVLAAERGLQVVSVVTLRDLIGYAQNEAELAEHLAVIQKYRDQYGSASSAK